MKIIEQSLRGLYLIETEPRVDDRGFFVRIFAKEELAAAGLDFAMVQSNRSFTQKKGTIRGMHFQRSPKWEGKIIQCLRGTTFQVVVDLRPDSSTFKKWISVELSGDNKKMLFVPKGFANGFQALADDCELLYFMSEFYSPEHATGVRYDDPSFGIPWPMENPMLSEKDKNLPLLADADLGRL
jgi:dTDP-4-dehydrorhamnose 3,5-epimerase